MKEKYIIHIDLAEKTWVFYYHISISMTKINFILNRLSGLYF